MPSPIHYRLLGYSVTLGLHLYTFNDVRSRLAITRVDPVVADFETLQIKFMTIWTFLLQIVYVCLGLWCDVLSLLKGPEKSLPTSLGRIREVLFSALVLPSSLLIPTVFWPMYLYDNGLVFPPFIGKILSPANNHGMHTLIAPVVLWELVFLERRKPNHVLNLSVLAVYQIAYIITLIETYLSRGVWIYPILARLQGTIFFPVLFIVVLVLLVVFYCIQWPLTAFVWEQEKIKKKTR